MKQMSLRPNMKLRQLMSLTPADATQLHRFVRVVLNMDVPRRVMTPGHRPPFAYLSHVFFEDGSLLRSQDAVVWACRGGGKTALGAAATLLDMLFKPGVRVRLLGGSLAQSAKMYEHLLTMLDQPLLRGICAGKPTQRRIQLLNGSEVELLAQSHRSVRGTRVHKLRCDEVEEFQPDVWQAAQMVTRSGETQHGFIRGGIEALSTMHRPLGIMSSLVAGLGSGVSGFGVEEAKGDGALVGADETESGMPQGKTRDPIPETRNRHRTALFRWNYLDVIARCPPQLPCDGCVLWADCRGRAKQATGFVPVADLIAQRQRTSNLTWTAEMLCQRPMQMQAVYPGFDADKHLQPHDRPCHDDRASQNDRLIIAGMDFGMRSPLTMLWASVGSQAGRQVVHVFDEYAMRGIPLEQHLAHIAARGNPKPRWIGIDPAGMARNSQTGLSDAQVLRHHGYRIRRRHDNIRTGVELIRRRLDQQTLLIDPRCRTLIQALQAYHFDLRHPRNEQPIKDGPDHACDALRYMLMNLEMGKVEEVCYL